MRPPEPTQPSQPPPDFLETDSFFPPQSFTAVGFFWPPPPMGPIQALGALLVQGSSLPPWSQVDTHSSAAFSKPKYFAPSPGSGWRGPALPPRHLPAVWEGMGTSGWGDPSSHRSHCPPSILPFHCRTPEMHQRGFGRG